MKYCLDFCHPLYLLCCSLQGQSPGASLFPTRPATYPRPFLDLQGLPLWGRPRLTLHLLFKAQQSQLHLICAALPSAISQLSLLSFPWVSAVPVPAEPLLPSPVLMSSSASSLGISFPVWIEPHLCLPFKPTSSRKPSVRLMAEVDFSLSSCPHSTACL